MRDFDRFASKLQPDHVVPGAIECLPADDASLAGNSLGDFIGGEAGQLLGNGLGLTAGILAAAQ